MLPLEGDPHRNSTSMESDVRGGGGVGVNGTRGNGSALGYPFKYRNCRRSKLPKPVVPQQQQQQQQSHHQKYPSEEMLYNEPNLIPKMELLKINYFNMPQKSTVQLKQMASRSRASVQDIKEDLIKKCGGRPASVGDSVNIGKMGNGNGNVIKVPEVKYAVYKKHNFHDDQQRLQQQQQQQKSHQRMSVGAAAVEEEEKNSKVFDFDTAKFRKKYFLFDTKRRNKKLDNIQFYFDNRSYERHVDNKLYGSNQRPSNQSHYSTITRRDAPAPPQMQPSAQQKKEERSLPPPPAKLSTWKDHLNNTRLGNVRELQHRYEKRTRTVSEVRESSRQPDSQNHHQKTRPREEDREINYIAGDTDKLIKSTSGAVGRRQIADKSATKKKHHHHHSQQQHQQPQEQPHSRIRESTTEKETHNKIKRLVHGFERKEDDRTPRSVEGRENFILYQQQSRMGSSVDNLLSSNQNKMKMRNTTGGGGAAAKSMGTPDQHKNNNIIINSRSTDPRRNLNFHFNGNYDRQEPLCKNIRTPRPMSMPLTSGHLVTTAEEAKSSKKCGYKNCQFQNCPMTASSSSTSSGCDSSNCSTLSNASCRNENCVSPINIVHRNQSVEEPRQELQCKRRAGYDPPVVKSMLPKSRTERISNIKQLERRIVTKYISDELRLLSNTVRDEEEEDDGGYEPVATRRDESVGDNKVKIYVGGTFNGSKSKQLDHEDSDKDYGYYDQVTAESGSCSERSFGSSRIERVSTKKDDVEQDSLVLEMSQDLMGKLVGCDGAIFFNESCYEEECKVQYGGGVQEKYVCVCGSSAKVTEMVATN